MKKIIIEPCFNEAHFMEYHIDNICEYFTPDIYVIAEGRFPSGPENSLNEDDKNFIDKYTLDGKRSFDFEELKQKVQKAKDKYKNTTFYLLEMDYLKGTNTQQAYTQAYMSFLDTVVPQPDDMVMAIECDLFFTRPQADICLKAFKCLKENEGFGSTFEMFFESPRVVLAKHRKRKVMFKYGDGSLYAKCILGNFDDSYHSMLKMYNFKLFHYEWIRPDPYFEMRLAQLSRGIDGEKYIRNARNIIIENKNIVPDHLSNFRAHRLNIRVSDYNKEDHPKHMWSHPNFRKYYD